MSLIVKEIDGEPKSLMVKKVDGELIMLGDKLAGPCGSIEVILVDVTETGVKLRWLTWNTPNPITKETYGHQKQRLSGMFSEIFALPRTSFEKSGWHKPKRKKENAKDSEASHADQLASDVGSSDGRRPDRS